MKIQMRWLTFIVITNVVLLVIMNTTTGTGSYAFPGVKYMQTQNDTVTIDAYEDKFNSTKLAENLTSQTPLDPFSFLINTFSGLISFVGSFSWLIDGVSAFINIWASFVPSTGAYDMLIAIGWIIRAITSFMFFTLILELWKGIEILP